MIRKIAYDNNDFLEIFRPIILKQIVKGVYTLDDKNNNTVAVEVEHNGTKYRFNANCQIGALSEFLMDIQKHGIAKGRETDASGFKIESRHRVDSPRVGLYVYAN